MILLLLFACRLMPSEADVFDPDGDGVPAESDCDNQNAAVAPGQLELPYDGLDNDCNAETPDDDLDGDGSPGSADCDDEDGASAPGLAETPYDAVDNDCDPTTADDDLDEDGAPGALDCDDQDPDRSPDHGEIGFNGIDDDCDEATVDASLDRSDRRVTGFESGLRAGESMALPGDLNGDGHPDLLVGGTGGFGAAYLLNGPFDDGAFDWADDAHAFTGPHDDSQAGHILDGGADLTGDGEPDFVVGAHRAEWNGESGVGAIYVLEGGGSAGDMASHAVATVFGETTADRFGRSLALSPDTTGDGRADLFVGAPYREPNNAGAIYLLAGPLSGERQVYASERLLIGEDELTLAQWLTTADLNGDGLDDLLAAAPELGDNGAALVIYGGEAARDIPVADADETIVDPSAPGNLGYRVLALPDEAGYYDLAMVTTTGLSGDTDGALFLVELSPGTSWGQTFARVNGMEGDQGAEWLDAERDPDGVLTLAVGANRALISSGQVYLWRDPNSLSGTHDASEANLVLPGSESIEAGVAVGLQWGLLDNAFTLAVAATEDDAGAGSLFFLALPD